MTTLFARQISSYKFRGLSLLGHQKLKLCREKGGVGFFFIFYFFDILATPAEEIKKTRPKTCLLGTKDTVWLSHHKGRRALQLHDKRYFASVRWPGVPSMTRKWAGTTSISSTAAPTADPAGRYKKHLSVLLSIVD